VSASNNCFSETPVEVKPVTRALERSTNVGVPISKYVPYSG